MSKKVHDIPQGKSNVKKKVLIEITNYCAGFNAGMASTMIAYPLDVARVRILFGTSMKNITNGLGFTSVFSIVKQGLVWPLQKTLQNYADERRFVGFGGILISGAIGNVIPGIICNPANVIKVRYMESHKAITLREICKDIINNEGWLVFKQGIEATILRDAVWGSVYFPVYTYFKQYLNEKSNNEFLVNMTCSSTAAATATTLSSFLDGIRLWQMKSAGKEGHYSFTQGLKFVLKPTRSNFLATFTGVLRVTISTTLGHLTYLYTTKFIELTNK